MAEKQSVHLVKLYNSYLSDPFCSLSPSHYLNCNVSCHVNFFLIDWYSLKTNYLFQRGSTVYICMCMLKWVFMCLCMLLCSFSAGGCLCVYVPLLMLRPWIFLSVLLSPSLLHTHTDIEPLFTVGLAKLLSEQMTKNKTVTSFLPTSPMLSVMVHINHTKLPCTQGFLFFPLPPSNLPSLDFSANGALFLADGFLMAKLWHATDGSLHLLQAAMQLMAVLTTKAVGGCSTGNQWCMWAYETTGS